MAYIRCHARLDGLRRENILRTAHHNILIANVIETRKRFTNRCVCFLGISLFLALTKRTEIRQLDSERQSLVYNHHHELIAASDTIAAVGHLFTTFVLGVSVISDEISTR